MRIISEEEARHLAFIEGQRKCGQTLQFDGDREPAECALARHHLGRTWHENHERTRRWGYADADGVIEGMMKPGTEPQPVYRDGIREIGL